jgi:predicted ATP-dependent serine protease
MRLKEVLRMGFAKVICPKRSLKAIPQDQRKALQVIGVANVKEAIHAAGLS